jgi:3-isopropylmalate dehydratase
MQNGMLPIALPQEQCVLLAKDAEAGLELEVDLEKQEVRRPNGEAISFTVDSFRRYCLLNGLDDIALTLKREEKIKSFEEERSETWPWLDGFGYKPGKIEVQTKKKMTKMEW